MGRKTQTRSHQATREKATDTRTTTRAAPCDHVQRPARAQHQWTEREDHLHAFPSTTQPKHHLHCAPNSFRQAATRNRISHLPPKRQCPSIRTHGQAHHPTAHSPSRDNNHPMATRTKRTTATLLRRRVEITCPGMDPLNIRKHAANGRHYHRAPCLPMAG
jgi:hypothetical protein